LPPPPVSYALLFYCFVATKKTKETRISKKMNIT